MATFHYKEPSVEDFREVTGIRCENDTKRIHHAIRRSVLRTQQAMHKCKLVEKTCIKVLLTAFLEAYDLDKD